MKGYKMTDGALSLVDMDNTLIKEQVKVKIEYSTLSNSDIKKYSRQLDSSVVFGKQAVGMIVEVGESVVDLQRGDRVVLYPYIHCGTCQYCKRDSIEFCDNVKIASIDVDGFLRDFVNVKQQQVYKLPDTVAFKDGIFIDYIAIALECIAKLDLQKGEHIVILEASIIGIIIAQLALYYQAIPIVIDNDNKTLDLLKKLGIVYTINPIDDEPEKRIQSITGGIMAEKAVLVASFGGVANCLDFIKLCGKVVVFDNKNSDANQTEINMVQKIIEKQATIIGVNNGCLNFIQAINMLANKNLSVSCIIANEIKFNSVSTEIDDIVKHPYKYKKVIVKT